MLRSQPNPRELSKRHERPMILRLLRAQFHLDKHNNSIRRPRDDIDLAASNTKIVR
jgi:hypothetical protein